MHHLVTIPLAFYPTLMLVQEQLMFNYLIFQKKQACWQLTYSSSRQLLHSLHQTLVSHFQAASILILLKLLYHWLQHA